MFILTFEGKVGVRMMEGEGLPKEMLHHARRNGNELSGTGTEPKKPHLVVGWTRRNELRVVHMGWTMLTVAACALLRTFGPSHFLYV